MSHLVRRKVQVEKDQLAKDRTLFFKRSGLNEPTEKSEETEETEDLRKSGVTETKKGMQERRAIKHEMLEILTKRNKKGVYLICLQEVIDPSESRFIKMIGATGDIELRSVYESE